MATSRRRQHGEGTCYEQRPGFWLAQVRLGGGQRLSATGPSATAARRSLAEKVARSGEVAAQAAHVTGSTADSERGEAPATSAYLRDWIDAIESIRSMKPQAWRRYKQIVDNHLVPFFGDRPLSAISKRDVIELLAALRRGVTNGSKQGDTSIHHIHAVLRKALEDAVAEEILDVNVARLVKAPPMKHRAKVFLSREEADRLLRAARGSRLEAAIVLAVCTGLQEGELLALRPQDLDLDARTLWVRSNAAVGWDGAMVLDDPKTQAGVRLLELPDVAMVALREHVATLPPGRDQLLFPSRHGGILGGTNFVKHHRHPVFKRSGLPHMTFHDVRHSAATILRSTGVVDEYTLSKILGHSTPAITSTLWHRGRRSRARRRDGDGPGARWPAGPSVRASTQAGAERRLGAGATGKQWQAAARARAGGILTGLPRSGAARASGEVSHDPNGKQLASRRERDEPVLQKSEIE